jgi:hypothetical protein
MIKSIRVTNHLGETIDLELRSPEKSGFFIRDVQGLGPTKSNINVSESLNVNGGVFNSARSTTRNIVFDVGFYNDGNESIETIRQNTYRFFPTNKPITLLITTENRTALTTGYTETNEPDIFSNGSGATISVVCPDAFFTEEEPVQTVFSGITGGFKFPFSNESVTLKKLSFGTVFIDTQKSVFYTGDEGTGIRIHVTFLGFVNDLTMSNITTGESMTIGATNLAALTGSSFKLHDELYISTLVGNKTIYLLRDGVWYNILGAMDPNSDWFRIDRGDNLFAYSAVTGTDKMQFLIEHNVLYGGV